MIVEEPRKASWNMRFSMRALLVAMALISAVLAALFVPLMKTRQSAYELAAIVASEQDAVATIEKAGGWLSMHYRSPSGPSWARSLLGHPTYHPVRAVTFDHRSVVSDRELEALSAFTQVDELFCSARVLPELAWEKIGNLRTLQSLNVHTAVFDEDLKYIGGLPNLRRLSLWESYVTDQGLAHLADLELESLAIPDRPISTVGIARLQSLDKLEHLYATNAFFDERFLEAFGESPMLETLAVPRTNLTDKALERLVRFKALERLDLSMTQVSDAGLQCLSALVTLRELDLVDTHVAGPGLESLLRLPNLVSVTVQEEQLDSRWLEQLSPQFRRKIKFHQELSVPSQRASQATRVRDLTESTAQRFIGEEGAEGIYLFGRSIENDNLRLLRGAARLRHVTLERTQVTGEGLVHLLDLPALQSISLIHARITDEGLRALARIPKLNAIYIQGTAITGAGFQAFGHSSQLQMLRIWNNTAVGDDGLGAIGRLHSLRRLELYDAHISGNGLKHLTGLSNLNHLKLTAAPVNDAGMVHVAGLHQLETLDIGRTDITDEGLQHLRSLKSLKQLDCYGARVTGAAATQLMQELPGLEINGVSRR